MQALYNFFSRHIKHSGMDVYTSSMRIRRGTLFHYPFGGVQFRRFGYTMKNTLGKIFKKSEAGEGEITPMQAVCTALAGTVSTGNIVGTSQAIALGGYGAIFWLWLAALLGMVIKYAEVTLSIRYREKDSKGDWVGGPMYYIKNGLGQKWAWLSVLFCIFAVLASFGIGNMSQAKHNEGIRVADAPEKLLPNSILTPSLAAGIFCCKYVNAFLIGSQRGVKTSAILYSIAETSKANGLKPYEYFKYLLEQMLVHLDDKPADYIDDLMPWSEKIPEYCRVKTFE